MSAEDKIFVCFGNYFLGRSTCWMCRKRRLCVANYCGAPYCKECWDKYWRADGYEGEHDPPFAAIVARSRAATAKT